MVRCVETPVNVKWKLIENKLLVQAIRHWYIYGWCLTHQDSNANSMNGNCLRASGILTIIAFSHVPRSPRIATHAFHSFAYITAKLLITIDPTNLRKCFDNSLTFHNVNWIIYYDCKDISNTFRNEILYEQ